MKIYFDWPVQESTVFVTTRAGVFTPGPAGVWMKKSKPASKERPSSGRPDEASHRVTVLHVDDDPNDTVLLQAATRKANVQIELQNVEDGECAIAYLSGTKQFADRKRY